MPDAADASPAPEDEPLAADAPASPIVEVAPEPEPDTAPAPGRHGAWPALAAGLMLVAGMLHLYLVEAHLAHARGTGLFFLSIGIAQTIWAIVFLRAPTQLLARAGFALLVVAPTLLYVATRVLRAPWSVGPEAVDVIGVVTQAAQLAAGITLLAIWRPTWPTFRVGQAVTVGMLLAVASYSGAIASEDVEWLASPEELHGHLAGHGPGGDHDGHGSDVIGIRGESIVGSKTYYGPPTGRALDDHCRAIGHSTDDCWLTHLQDKLVAEGSVPAFDLLQELMAVNRNADHGSHALAHVLGHAAYNAYGLDIQLTLEECSYDVFQGCLHGALQAYFADLGQSGARIDSNTIQVPCAGSETRFESYACIHGIGHGVMIHTNYGLHEALDICALFGTHFERSSCYGGVVMENVVAYLDSTKPDYVPHNHGDGPPEFWVDPDDPAYPCNVVKSDYARDCWRMQTSLILHFNDGDFEDAARICDEEAGDQRLDCYNSLGRDAGPFAKRDPMGMSQRCSYGTGDAHTVCVKAFTSGVILQNNDPHAGFALCAALPDHDKEPCYQSTGRQGASFLGTEGSETFCEAAPDEYVAACEAGRG